MKFYYFAIKQLKQIQQGDISIFSKKAWAMLMILLALPFVIIMRLLKPLVLIRLGGLPNHRIGHFSTNTALYAVRRQIYGLKSFDIFYYESTTANDQLKKMWNKKLCVCSLARWWSKVNKLVPGGQAHIITEQVDGRDPQGLYAQFPVPLAFTDQEERHGQESLRRLGIPEGARFVCFNARNEDYIKKTFPHLDGNYHNYRNSDILTYVPAIKEMMRRGFYAVRMGKIETVKIPISDPRLIDYSMMGRTDFMDIYLGAKCHFFLGGGGGLTSIPRLFKRPIAWVNFIPLWHVHSWDVNSIFIPKKLWLISEKRFLTYRELLTSKMGKLLLNEEYQQSGIEPVSNSDEEITDLALELDDRLNGKWKCTEEDEWLQQKFWDQFPIDQKFHGLIKARIGTSFLRKNRELLGNLLQAH